MSHILVINAHIPYPGFSPGKLNASLVEVAVAELAMRGHATQVTTMTDNWDIDAEIEKHRWADVVLVQTPVNWMGVPWLMKKYIDLVYTYGLDGRLGTGDGRSRQDPSLQYGSGGGAMAGKRYLLSLTFNAPQEAFDDPKQTLFAGKSVDDLFVAMHGLYGFFGMKPLPTFACFDVIKAPQIEADFARWRQHLADHLPASK